jgi:hypothetical protein
MNERNQENVARDEQNKKNTKRNVFEILSVTLGAYS